MSARIRLRPTMTSDIQCVPSLEQDLESVASITPFEAPPHEGSIRFADMRNVIIGSLDDGLDAVRTADGFDSLVVVSVLATEFEQRRVSRLGLMA